VRLVGPLEPCQLVGREGELGSRDRILAGVEERDPALERATHDRLDTLSTVGMCPMVTAASVVRVLA
jgi:hypothetical protein